MRRRASIFKSAEKPFATTTSLRQQASKELSDCRKEYFTPIEHTKAKLRKQQRRSETKSLSAQTKVSYTNSTPLPLDKRKTPRSLATSAAKEKSPRTSLIYDNDWVNKQSSTFKNWMNFMFFPVHEASEQQNEQNLISLETSEAPDHNTFRTILLNRHWGQSRQKAYDLLNTGEMRFIRAQVKTHVEKESITMRVDRDVFADVSLRSFMVDLFLSYEQSWLRVALETLFNIDLTHNMQSKQEPSMKSVPTKSCRKNQSKMKFALRKCIIERVLGDPFTMRKFTGGRYKVLSGKFERKYRCELRKKILQNVLILVIFLA